MTRIKSSLNVLRPGLVQRAACIGASCWITTFVAAPADAQPFPPVFELEELKAGQPAHGFSATGADFFDQTGTGLAVIGDINDDDYDDLAIASEGETAVYILFGGPNIGDGNPIDLGQLDGTNGFVFDVPPGMSLGSSVASAGDFNNDGIDDIIMGARGLAPNGRTAAGGAYIIYGDPDIGKNGVFNFDSLDGSNGFVANGILEFDQAGGAVAGGRDLNGDQIDDVAIGAIQCSAHGTPYPGQTYVLFGGKGIGANGSYELSSLPARNGDDGFVFDGIGVGNLPCDYFGATIDFLEDVNKDDYNDLIVGAPATELKGNSYTGAAFVLFGGPDVAGNGLISAEDLDGSNGFSMWGWSDHASFGNRVRHAGDFNHDGLPDFAVGSDALSVSNRTFCGATFVIFGRAGLGSSGSFDARFVDGANGMAIFGANEIEFSGRSIDSVEDFNGDGVNDLVIGAPSQTTGPDQTGRAYVVFGGTDVGGYGVLDLATLDGTNGLRLEGYEIDSLAGYRVAAGPLNDDALADIVVAAPFSDANGLNSGEVFVLFGRETPTPLELIVDPLVAGERASFVTEGATTGRLVYFAYGLNGYGIRRISILDISLALAGPIKLIGSATANINGTAVVQRRIPAGETGVEVFIQSFEFENVSGVVRQDIQ